MRKKLIFFSLFILFCSVNLSTAKDKVTTSIPQNADFSINNIKLCDPKSAEEVIGKEIHLNSDQDLPYARFYNKDKTQVLILVFFPGDITNSFCEFKIKRTNNIKMIGIRTLENTKDFVSGKNIRLGITKNKLIKILGEQFTSEIKNGVLVIKYKIDDFANSEFLKAYNMPIYYGEYKFRDNKLIEFSFGFEYP